MEEALARYKYELISAFWDSTFFNSPTDNVAMSPNNLCYLLLLSILINCAIAEVKNESGNDVKTVTNRRPRHLSYEHHGHTHPAIASASHYHLPPSFAKYPVLHKPLLALPTAPQFIPAAPHYHLVPGGASVTSFSVNYPRWPRPVVPRPFIPVATPAIIPPYHHHHHSFHQHSAFVPHYHSPAFVAHKPVIPVAVPYPGIRYPKFPVFINNPKPLFTHSHPQFIPIAQPHPTFLPVPVPSNPQPTTGTGEDTNLVSVTQDHPHDWRPIMMTQATQPTFTNKHPLYNYHAPSVAFNNEQSMNDVISGQGQVSSQLAHQLALYRHQQQQQEHIQQEESRLTLF